MSAVHTTFALQSLGTLQKPRMLPITTLSPKILAHVYSLTRDASYHYDCVVWVRRLGD